MAEEDEHFQETLRAYGVSRERPGRNERVPRFYWKLPSEEDVLRQKLREEARSTFLQRMSRQLLDNSELKALWLLLDQHQTNADEQVGDDDARE